jgi:NAD(P)H dehydrogenase (quinone)
MAILLYDYVIIQPWRPNMKVLIVHHSRTGRTAALANEIAIGAQRVEGSEVVVATAAEVCEEDFLEADAVIAGSPVYFGSMSAELKKVFDDFIPVRKQMENKIGAAFATCNFHTGGKETTMLSIIQALLIYGMVIAGDPMSASGHYGVAFSGEMDEEARGNARKLGERVARLASATADLRQQKARERNP